MNTFRFIDELGQNVYAANEYGILVYDREEDSKQSLTKINVLTQTGISCFECIEEAEVCIVGYDNGNLDIIDRDNNVTNQPAIPSSNTIGDKRINRILSYNGKAYLVTGIGLMEMDLETFDILEYSRMGFNGEQAEMVSANLIDGDIYFANSAGLFREALSVAFIDPQPEQLSFDLNPLQVTQFFDFDGEVHLLYQNEDQRRDTLFQLQDDAFVARTELANSEMRWVDQKDDRILITGFTEVREFDNNLEETRNLDRVWAEPGMDVQRAYYSHSEGELLIADAIHGGVIATFEDSENSNIMTVSSPKSGLIGVIEEVDGAIYAMPGGNDFTFNIPYLHELKDGDWSSKLMFTEASSAIRNPLDITEADEKKYLSFSRDGFMVLDDQNNILEHYTPALAPEGAGTAEYYGVNGVEADENGNIWMLNNRANAPLSVLGPEGNWSHFSFQGFPNPFVDDLELLSNGMLVFGLKDQGLIIFDPNDTPFDPNDDSFVNINASPTEGNLNTNTVNCIVEDLDGELWIGTDEGIGIIYNPENAFDPNFEVQKIIVNQDGFNGYLFETDPVISIAVDGANRKWVAPRGAGLFLISPEGQEQLLRFTEDDSPLLDDNIEDLAIFTETGELFIATQSGLQSYRSDATEPEESLSQIKVFPNPVKPGYDGLISFTGLTSESYVRVTDAAGNLVYESQSRGGMATWDGTDQFGQRISSGVYLIFAASRDGAAGAVSKLLFLD